MNGDEAAWRRDYRLLWSGQFFASLGLMALVPLLPFYLETLGGSDVANAHWTGAALAAPAFSVLLVAPLWGWLGDRFGRKTTVICAFLGFALSMILMGFARTPLEFIFSRLLQGACGLTVSIAAFVSVAAPEPKRGWALGGLQSATAAGSLAGPLLGGLMADLWSLRPLLWFTGVASAMGGLIALRVLTQQAVEATGAVHAFPRQAVSALFCDPGLRAFVLAGICIQAGAYGLVSVFTLQVKVLVSNPSYAATWVGILNAATWGVTFLAASWWGSRNDRTAVERNFSIAACGCAFSIGLQALVTDVAWFLPWRMAQGFFFAALIQSVYLRISQAGVTLHQGTQIGVANSSLTLGQIIGPLASVVLSTFFTLSTVFLFMAGAVFVAAGLVWRQRRPWEMEYVS
ncbi:MFS-type permease, putative Siderophore biosynthesis protein SbnD [Nitrospina gracilis 3/211]|uniref:MFS-type permease, putative Siderophore biosynthesis protein SbnD n=1 Tax=Nitrospina gracilis (strain 3/211) TaxID=1266370 RepID=M1YJP0_NITG3|nr:MULTISPECIES: MFS transporter [Nitrospina]MCF8723602.1 MFS family permease [Nitrospina sp. Nb-3]CCQ90682.1 MFS-type permease, putative Siderophore biosynthesis protein SbnD [Nitrospina gracilis 3/211]